MKARYKLLFVVLLLWLGMSAEGARRNPEPTVRLPQNATLDDRIDAYEHALMEGFSMTDEATANRNPSGTTQQGNLVARTGRNIGDGLQTIVRELLRGIVRFFDGVIR